MVKVKVSWLVNSLIADTDRVVFVESQNNEKIICYWLDDYYKEHREEIWEYVIDFIKIEKNITKVFCKINKKERQTTLEEYLK